MPMSIEFEPDTVHDVFDKKGSFLFEFKSHFGFSKGDHLIGPDGREYKVTRVTASVDNPDYFQLNVKEIKD